MTGRDRVLAAFAHEEADRVPAWCGAMPAFWEKAKLGLGLDDESLRLRLGDDFRRVWARDVGPEAPLSPGATSRSVFGIERIGIGCGQATSHPLADATQRGIEEYPWPDPCRVDVSEVRREAESHGGRYAVLGGEWSPFWHDALDLLGPGLFLRMRDEPAVVHAVLGHVIEYYFEVSRRIFDAAAHALDVFFIGNDFGTQAGPMIGPAAFREFIMPYLGRLIDLGHAYRLKVMLHCCGGFEPLIPLMIDAGLDGLHAVQPRAKGMDLRILKARYGSRILFNGCIDSQSVLIEGTPESVRASTRDVLDIMKPGGGYVAGASHDAILEETPVENVVAMFDAIREFGAYGPM